MDITLINPPLDKQTTSKFPMSGVPVGIAQLAGFLRANDIEVSVIDAVIERYTPEEAAKAVEKIGPKVVGVTCLTENRYAAVKTARVIKKRLPDVFIVFGGLHPSMTDELMLRNYPFIDMIIRGEGEFPLLEVVEAIITKRSPYKVAGISFIKDEKFHSTECRKFLQNLDDLPFPAYDLFPMAKYENPPDLKGSHIKSTPITASRGCPMGCVFCATSKYWGKVVRTMSNQRLIREIKWLRDEYGINYLRFVDDLFTINKKRVIEFCEMMTKQKLDFEFRLQSRVDTVDEKVLGMLKKAGCDSIEYGAESGSNKILQVIGKRIVVDQIKKANQKTRDVGIISKYFLIIGNPQEREVDTYATFKLIKESKPDWIGIGPMSIYPGTEVYRLALEKGICKEDVWLKYINPKTGNAPLYTEYYDDKEMVFLSQLARVWSMKNSLHRSEYRMMEKVIGQPLTESLVKKIIFHRPLRKMLSRGSSIMGAFLP